MPSNVRVAVRVRPLLGSEVQSGHRQSLLDVNSVQNQITVNQDSPDGDQSKVQKKTFRFDKIIDQQYSQAEVFEQLQIGGLINKVMEGFHATIFAYGQTGSGKTYTMEGYKYEEAKSNERAGKAVIQEGMENGITIRSIREIFRQAEEMKKEKHVTISCSFLQIYNEKVYDLLNAALLKKGKPGGAADQGLRIRWNKNEQFTVENLYVFKCDSPEHALTLYNKGIKNKIVASHNLNHASSRSHSIFSLTVEMVDNAAVDNSVVSKLQLVDLAGSERQSATGTTGLAQKESIDINKSLFTLRQVITALADSARLGKKAASLQHIPYRDSKLTCLLKQSIGGNSYCLMIACLSPSDAYLEENLSTLTYATKASFISNEPTKNEDPKTKLINELKQKVVSLQRELASANNHIQFLSNLTGQPVPDEVKDIMAMPEASGSFSAVPFLSAQEQLQKHQIPTQDEPPRSTSSLMEVNSDVKRKPTTEIVEKPTQEKKAPQQALMQQQDPFHRLGHDQLSQRLIESVAMVKELMQSNRVLRDTIDQINNANDKNEGELYTFQVENRELRDRIEILESVIASTTHQSEFDALDWRTLLAEEEGQVKPQTPQIKGSTNVINEMATELIEQKKANRTLQSELDALRTHFDDLQTQHTYSEQEIQHLRTHPQQMSSQQYTQQQMVNIYGGSGSKHQPVKHQASAPPMSKQPQVQQPQSKQEALRLLNDMMSKRLQNKRQ